MNKKMEFIDNLLYKYNLSIPTLNNCFMGKKELINNYRKLFEFKDDFSLSVVSYIPELFESSYTNAIIELLYNENKIYQNKIDSEEEKRDYIKFLLTGFFFSTPFYIYSSNWCYFMECEVAHRMESKKILSPLQTAITEIIAAFESGQTIEKDDLFERIGKKRIPFNLTQIRKTIEKHKKNGDFAIADKIANAITINGVKFAEYYSESENKDLDSGYKGQQRSNPWIRYEDYISVPLAAAQNERELYFKEILGIGTLVLTGDESNEDGRLFVYFKLMVYDNHDKFDLRIKYKKHGEGKYPTENIIEFQSDNLPIYTPQKEIDYLSDGLDIEISYKKE